MYRVVILPAALKDLQTIPKTYEPLMRGRIAQLASDPRPRGCKKLQSRMFRVRQGVYRIIYRVDDENKVISIARVKSRKEAYR